MAKLRKVEIKPGVKVEVLVVRFDAGWEFDCPTIVLDPVFRFHEDGQSCDGAIEDVLIDACTAESGAIEDHTDEYRRWSIRHWRKKAEAYLAGQRFPNRHFEAKRETAEFELDKDGQLTVKGWSK